MTAFQTIFLILCTTSFASMIGAYYGTIDYRIRKDLPLITAHCYCPQCNHELAMHHQLPILGWFLVKGKCAYCHSPISIRYPLFEASYTILYVTVFILFFDTPMIYSIIWFLFYMLLLILRCQKHFKTMIKGLCIITLYHVLYCGLLYIITTSTT